MKASEKILGTEKEFLAKFKALCYIRENVWRFLTEAGIYLSPSNMRKFFTGKEGYECEQEEIAEAQKKVDSLSFTHSMLVVMHYAIKNIGDIYDWKGYYKQETGKALVHAYETLKPYGWTFANDDDEQLLTGTHELYVN